MRSKRTLLLLYVMLVALMPFAQAAWADSVTAPAWSSAWWPQPIAHPADISAMNTKVLGEGVPGNAAQVSFPYVGPVPWAEGLSPMPLVGTPADYAAARAAAAQLPQPAIPSTPLVETPHDRSVNAIEVPNGGIVFPDGTVVAGGTGVGSSNIGLFSPPDPPLPVSWDSIGTSGMGIPSFNAPVLTGP